MTPYDLLHLHCQRSTPQVSLTKHLLCSLFFSKVFHLFILSQAAPSSAIAFGKVLHGLMDLILRYLIIHNTMALVQTFNSKFLSDLGLGNSLWVFIPLIIIVFTTIIPSQSNRRWSLQRKTDFIKPCVNVPAIYKITDIVFLFNFCLENNLSMYRCIYRGLNIPEHKMRM